jgi:hypothetical protein
LELLKLLAKERRMEQWNKINWPALNRRAREIEVDLWRWSPERGNLKEIGPAAPTTQADRATARALMVWSDDGGPAA